MMENLNFFIDLHYELIKLNRGSGEGDTDFLLLTISLKKRVSSTADDTLVGIIVCERKATECFLQFLPSGKWTL